MTDLTRTRIPDHLRRYVVSQNYERYTPEDQAVWRFVLRQLKDFLGKYAHESYLSGLTKTGLDTEEIPRIDVIDQHLEKFGWGALPVSGFIPPAAFMEFQSLGLLPIACDMRTLEHLTYTPAPDIVHEAAGHAPILANPEYAAYLRQYGEVAKNSIISKQDLDQYEAIRVLSDVKEDPSSTPADIEAAEKQLTRVNQAMSGVSEAALLSRMNWWTAEYGLVGKLEDPRIFGAGLLSSVGESAACLRPEVKKIPLSVDCVNYTYDITEPQPQLFVARDFAQLGEVLEKLAGQLAYRRGGVYGLNRAKEAETVNTVQLTSGLQISGKLKEFINDSHGDPAYLIFEGPSQLAVGRRELSGQGVKRHAHGFSSPTGSLKGEARGLETFDRTALEVRGLKPGQRARLEFTSGVTVDGVVKNFEFADGQLVVLTWTDCKVTLADRVLFDPAWGEYDMAVGMKVNSVFAGPADREAYGESDSFVAKRVPSRKFSPEELRRHAFYQAIRELRGQPKDLAKLRDLIKDYVSGRGGDWLQGVELLELTYAYGLRDNDRADLFEVLKPENFPHGSARQSLSDGVELAKTKS